MDFKDIQSNSFVVNYFNRYNWDDYLLRKVSFLSCKIRDFELRQRMNGLLDGFYYKDIVDYIENESNV